MEAFAPRMRHRIVELYQDGLETEDIAAMLGSSLSGTRRVWQQFREEDRTAAKPNAGGRRSMLSAESKAVLLQLLEEHPDAFLPELAEQVERRLGLRVHPQTVGRWLRELGVTRKKSRCTPASSNGPTCRRGVTAGSTRWRNCAAATSPA
jgi:transposase